MISSIAMKTLTAVRQYTPVKVRNKMFLVVKYGAALLVCWATGLKNTEVPNGIESD